MDYIVGMDTSTTASKGVLYQENGKEIAKATVPYSLIQGKVGQAEEDPQAIFNAVQRIVFDLSKKVSGKISAISWSSQMRSLVGLGKDNQLLTNSITRADNRSREVATTAKKNGLAGSIYRRTGMSPHPMAPMYELLRIEEELPELFTQVQKWIGIKEYIIWRLTGKMMTDTTMVAGTGLLNLKSSSWDEDLLNQTNLEKEKLPTLDKPETVVGGIIPNYIQKLGLSDRAKIILGANDGYLSTIGVGVLNEESFALNVRTSGVVRMITPEVIVDSENRFFCHPVDKKHCLLSGPANNGGIVLEWAGKTIFGPDQTAEDFINVAESVPAGSSGLIFHPYLGGGRAPIWNIQARESFIRLTRNHTKPQMARSVLERIVFSLLGTTRSLRERAGEPDVLRVAGGFVKNDFIRQLIADIFSLPVIVIKNDQDGTLAAVFLAQAGMREEADLKRIAEKVDGGEVYFPSSKSVAVYQDIIPVYREVEYDLDQSYKKIVNFQEKYPRLFE